RPRPRRFPYTTRVRSADQGVGFTAFSPLAGGWLTGKYRAGATYPEGSRMTLRPEPYRHLETAAVFGGLSALADEARACGVDVSRSEEHTSELQSRVDL